MFGSFGSDYINFNNPTKPFHGYHGVFKVGGINGHKLYTANSGTAHGLQSQRTSGSNFIQSSVAMYALCNNNNNAASVSQPTKDIISFLGATYAMDAAESSALYDAIQAARVAFGGGYR